MTNDPTYQRLRDLSWRRDLTDAEDLELRAWLAAHPDAQAEWQAEAALNEALMALPDAPLASNFTARVLHEVERHVPAKAGWLSPKWRSWRRWLPRMAVAGLVLGGGLFSYTEVTAARRANLARSAVVVSEISSLPSPQILEDFDAIRFLPPTPPADEDLLNLLR